MCAKLMHSQFFITRGNKVLEMDMVICRFDKIKKRHNVSKSGWQHSLQVTTVFTISFGEKKSKLTFINKNLLFRTRDRFKC